MFAAESYRHWTFFEGIHDGAAQEDVSGLNSAGGGSIAYKGALKKFSSLIKGTGSVVLQTLPPEQQPPNSHYPHPSEDFGEEEEL